MNQKKPNPVDVHIGSRIRLRRNMLGMSQEKLGEALGITFQQIQKYEKGVNRVGGSRMQHIANALNVPPAYFYEDAPGAENAAEADDDPVIKFMRSHEAIRLTRAFMAISDHAVRRKLIELARTIAGQDEAV